MQTNRTDPKSSEVRRKDRVVTNVEVYFQSGTPCAVFILEMSKAGDAAGPDGISMWSM